VGVLPFQLGLPEMILVLVIALVVLGPKRLPEAGRAAGRGIREFKDAFSVGESRPAGAGAHASAAPSGTPRPRYTPPKPYEPPPPPIDPGIYVPHAELASPPVVVTEATSPAADLIV
jgi:sec-independent protein translocase protein TatA